MRIIGLTGGIATGKSTVASLLAQLGAHIIDADQVARQVVEPGRPAYAEIVEAFGSGILNEAGALDRAALARRIFADDQARRQLNAMTHPRVRAEFRRRLAALQDLPGQERPPAVVLDVPLLFEGGTDRLCDEVWVVWTARETQQQRLQARDGLSDAEVEQRIESQLPLEEKRRRADVVIDNDGRLEATREQVEEAWSAALKRL